MRSFIVPAAFLLCFPLLPATLARAQCGTGTGVLDMPDTAPMGSLVTVNVDAPPPATVTLLMFSLGQGPNDLGSYGTICLDFPPIFAFVLPLDGAGHAEITVEVPCDPAGAGITVYGQFLTCSPGGGSASHGSSNQDSTIIEDGLGTGSFCTFTQDGWHQDCTKHPAGCILNEDFATVFPNGVIIGDPDGNDTDSAWASQWTLIGKIQDFLPQTLRPTLLFRDRLNPICDSGFCFGGDLLAAKLNVAFDDFGSFDDMKCRNDLKLGDLIFIGCVDEDLIGWTVRDLIDLADLAISGALGPGPFDIDGDLIIDVRVDDLKQALAVLNANFEDCTIDRGCLGLP